MEQKEIKQFDKKPELLRVIEIEQNVLNWYKKEKALKEDIHSIVNKNTKLINPEYEYQTKDEFWELQVGLNKVAQERDIFNLTRMIKASEQTIANYKEELEELEKEDM